ncbi:hypothetical protein K7711_36630 [Nocardia sp. CA2R105]|uniref:hypothetical protein n=1 Tax=Nocardia coffeae TaxID=2873381 RepID=UPI001CA67807|nr:hypothetical protein [Nocardia coffeae]MBY8862051.1 hypothetical protein [Nocardia coffeae]
MAVIVQTIGTGHWDIPSQVWEQLRLAHSLRDDLVDLQHQHDAALKELWSAFPGVRRVEGSLAAVQQRANELNERVRAERSQQRTKRIIGPLAEEQDAVRAQLKTLRSERQTAIAKVHKPAKPALAIIKGELKVGYRRLFDKYCRRGGLFWATHNDVVQQHQAAVRRVATMRKEGRSAELRHHRFDGGTLAVQLQREAGEPPRTPEVVANSHGKYHRVIQIPWTDPKVWATLTRPQQREVGRAVVRMRCGSASGEDQWVDIPVQQHRMLPADADITWVKLTVTRTAGTWQARLAVVAELPDPAPIPLADGPTVALHLGWRNHEHGIQVANWRATTPLDIPSEWQHVLRADHDGITGVVVLPNQIVDGVDRAADIASQRDTARNRIQASLLRWLEANGSCPHPRPQDEGEELTGADVARWKSSARFAAIAFAWRDTPPPQGKEVAARLESWRRLDKALWEQQEHGRRRHLRRRDDMWRNVAAIIAGQAAHVVLDDMSVAQLARLENPDLTAAVRHRVARRRDTASPGRLRDVIHRTCVRRGVTVTTVPAAGLSRIHAACGYEHPADDWYRSQPTLCGGCQKNYDPDRSATLLMLQRACIATSVEQ